MGRDPSQLPLLSPVPQEYHVSGFLIFLETGTENGLRRLHS